MILWATDYDSLKTYSIKINDGHVSGNTIVAYDDIDQVVEGVILVSIDFNHVSESCTIKMTYIDGKIQVLTLIGAKNG